MEAKISRNADGSLEVPSTPVIPFIEGDGIGSDVWAATRPVLEAAVKKAYGDARKISWLELPVGEKFGKETGVYLPDAALATIREHVVAIKGPLTTPVGKGIRSLNVSIRQKLDLFACVRPVTYIEPVASPMKRPEAVDMVIFRENTEDVYAGIEWESGTDEVKKVAAFLTDTMGVALPEGAGIGIKPISAKNSKRLIRSAIQHALDNNRPTVTLMHKGNIMKFTEGAFAKWGYELVKDEFAGKVITEADLKEEFGGKRPEGVVVLKDRIADMLFQDVLFHPEAYDVIACPNLNGDYLSDALAAQVGGLGLAPGANIGDEAAVFEATHGTAPTLAGLDKVNPGSLMLSGAMMLEYMGWKEAAVLVRDSLQAAVRAGRVTFDLAGEMEGAKEISCSEFGRVVEAEIASR